MTLLRVLLPLIFLVSFAGISAAQDTSGDASVLQPGQQSLEDIMARQRGEDVPFGAELPSPQRGKVYGACLTTVILVRGRFRSAMAASLVRFQASPRARGSPAVPAAPN